MKKDPATGFPFQRPRTAQWARGGQQAHRWRASAVAYRQARPRGIRSCNSMTLKGRLIDLVVTSRQCRDGEGARRCRLRASRNVSITPIGLTAARHGARPRRPLAHDRLSSAIRNPVRFLVQFEALRDPQRTLRWVLVNANRNQLTLLSLRFPADLGNCGSRVSGLFPAGNLQRIPDGVRAQSAFPSMAGSMLNASRQ